jgi:hypothetical protein
VGGEEIPVIDPLPPFDVPVNHNDGPERTPDPESVAPEFNASAVFDGSVFNPFKPNGDGAESKNDDDPDSKVGVEVEVVVVVVVEVEVEVVAELVVDVAVSVVDVVAESEVAARKTIVN